MSTLITILSLSIILGIGFFVFYRFLNISEEKRRNEAEQSRKEMEERLNQMSSLVRDHQSNSLQSLEKQFQTSHKIIQDVTTSLTSLKETNLQVVGFAEQMKSLENILKNPKQRGILGEYFLETLLANVLPPAGYKMQYKMKNGEIVDAVIFDRELMIPTDAKFSLEKYNLMMEENDKGRREELEKGFKADLKARIDETAKYIRPEEGTTDFAFMFIPAEGVYYNLLVAQVGGSLNVNAQDLIEYAHRKKVNIVSPTTFYAYLKTVLFGMRAQKMESSIQQVLSNVEQLGRHMLAYDDYFEKLGKHLGTTVSTYNSAYREFKKIDKDVMKLTDGKVGGQIDPLLLEKPLHEEL